MEPIANNPSDKADTLKTPEESLALRLLCAESGWLSEAELRKTAHQARDEGQTMVIVRSVEGMRGNGRGDPERFKEARYQLVSESTATAVQRYLEADPDFAQRWSSDPTMLIGCYPMCSPTDGEPLMGWQISKASFKVKDPFQKKA